MWLRRAMGRLSDLQEVYLSKAKLDGYRSTAAYTLLDLNQRYSFLKPGIKVIDLGAAPGGWTQVTVNLVQSDSSKPKVLAVDCQSMAPIPGAKILELDLGKSDSITRLFEVWTDPVDVILSDLSGDLLEDRDMDCGIVAGLNLDAMRVAKRLLKPGGTLIMKMLMGFNEADHYVPLTQTFVKSYFKELQRVRSSISIPSSSELFYLGRGWIPDPPLAAPAEQNTNLLRKAAVIAKSSGVELENDVMKMMEEAIGEKVDFEKNNLGFLKDDDSTLSQLESEISSQLSFNFPVPKNFQELQQLHERLKKDHASDAKPGEDMEDESGEEEEGQEDEGATTAKQEKTPLSEAERLIDQIMSKPEDPEFEEGPPMHNVEEILNEMEKDTGDTPEDEKVTERRVKQQAQYDEWSKALKNKDIWGKNS